MIGSGFTDIDYFPMGSEYVLVLIEKLDKKLIVMFNGETIPNVIRVLAGYNYEGIKITFVCDIYDGVKITDIKRDVFSSANSWKFLFFCINRAFGNHDGEEGQYEEAIRNFVRIYFPTLADELDEEEEEFYKNSLIKESDIIDSITKNLN